MDIKGKVAIITGAASGIGQATAYALAQAGAKAIGLADIDAAGLLETATGIQLRGAQPLREVVDVGNSRELSDFFMQVEAHFGSVSIIHNNAGTICGEPIWPETALDRIESVINVNLKGVAFGNRLAVDLLSRNGGGVIINTASTAALGPMPADPIYSSTKAAVVGLTQASAGLAVSHNIRVNAILPGMVDTAFINRTGDGSTPAAWLDPVLANTILLTAEQVADTVLQLIEDDQRKGECLVINNPKSDSNLADVQRLRNPAEYYQYITSRLT